MDESREFNDSVKYVTKFNYKYSRMECKRHLINLAACLYVRRYRTLTLYCTVCMDGLKKLFKAGKLVPVSSSLATPRVGIWQSL